LLRTLVSVNDRLIARADLVAVMAFSATNGLANMVIEQITPADPSRSAGSLPAGRIELPKTAIHKTVTIMIVTA